MDLGRTAGVGRRGKSAYGLRSWRSPSTPIPTCSAIRRPARHAERPARLAAVSEALGGDRDLDLEPREAPLAARADLLRVHDEAYVAAIDAAAPSSGVAQLDPDTFMSAGSLTAARRAAGAVVDAVRAVASGEIQRAFCAVRPPGHHAGPGFAMGFCIFSNIAIAARAAQGRGPARGWRSSISTSTTATAPRRCSRPTRPVLFASVHQSPLYPGTGDPSETGAGNVVNAVVAPDAARARPGGAPSRG